METLTVLFIVSLLVAFVVGLVRHGTGAAERSRARADLHLLAEAAERYSLRFGEYPGPVNVTTPVTNLLALVTTVPGQPEDAYAFANLLPQGFSGLDPWGRSYLYTRRAPAGEGEVPPEEGVHLLSLGPDKEQDDDDLSL